MYRTVDSPETNIKTGPGLQKVHFWQGHQRSWEGFSGPHERVKTGETGRKGEI